MTEHAPTGRAVNGMTEEDREAWLRYRAALDALPPGAELCSGSVQWRADHQSEPEAIE